MDKPVIRISEAEAARDFPSVLARVRAGSVLIVFAEREVFDDADFE